MALPPPPKKAEQAAPATTVATAAPAAVAQPVVDVATDATVEGGEKRKIVQFAPADAPMPDIGGFKADKQTFEDLHRAISSVVNIDAITAAMETLTKDKVPGSKIGRNVYSTCNAIANIKGCYDRMTGVAAVRQSNSKVAKLESKLKSLAQLIDPEKAKAMGIDLAALLAE